MIATFLDLLVTALNASTITEFAEVTWSRSTSTLIGTADTAGKPFTATMSTTETGGGAADSQTIDGGASSAGTSTTACSGPNFWNVAGNWSGGAVPVNSDDVIIENTPTAAAGPSSASISLGAQNTAPPLTPNMTIERTQIIDSAGSGILLNYYGGLDSAILVTITDTEIRSSGNIGIRVDGPSFGVSPSLFLGLNVVTTTVTESASTGIAAGIADLQVIELPFERQRRVALAAAVAGQTGAGVAWRLHLANVQLDTSLALTRGGPIVARRRQAEALLEALSRADLV